MKKLSKKILITTLLFALCLITMSTVNAAENTTDLGNLISTANPDSTIELEEATYKTNVTNIIINKNLTIMGKGADKTIIDANKTGRIFNITSGGILTLINLTLIKGNANYGGAIYNDGGTLTITNCTFNNNTATTYGGVIYNNRSANFIITSSTFNNNTATTYGGVIYNNRGANFIITGSTFNNNTATTYGGAIYNYQGSDMDVSSCTFTDNNANEGGAILNDIGSGFTVVNSTFIRNNATNGGVIFNNANRFTVVNSTFTGNNASNHGGVILSYNGSTDFKVVNSTFTGNTATNGGIIFNYGNITVSGCTFINNNNTIHNLVNCVVNYNRFVNNTGYDISNYGGSVDVDFNWWGSNTPDMSKIIGVVPNNYFIIYITNITSLDSNGTVIFQYIFKLNNSESFDASLLPYFVTDVYTNLTSGVIESFDARNNYVFNITVDQNGKILYTFITDNEVETLEGMLPKLNTFYIISVPDGKVGKPINIRGAVRDENKIAIANTNITIIINGQNITVTTNDDGEWSYTFTPTSTGNFNVTISWDGNDTHEGFSNFTSFSVYKIVINSTINSNNGKTGKPINITGVLIDEFGDPIANTNIVISINGQNYTVKTNNTGRWILTYTPLTTSTHSIVVYFSGNTIYEEFTNTASFNVEKIKTILTISAPTINQGKKTNIKATLKDSEGNFLKGEKITITINKKTYTATTNSNGVVTFKISGLKGGKFKISGKYLGNTKYGSSATSNTQVVKSKVDLAIVKAVKVKNRNKKISTYKLTIQNKGSLKSKATTLKLWHIRNGLKIKAKTVQVKAIEAGKKITLIVKYYSDRSFHKYCKQHYFMVNPKKTMNEITYKNNLKVIG